MLSMHGGGGLKVFSPPLFFIGPSLPDRWHWFPLEFSVSSCVMHSCFFVPYHQNSFLQHPINSNSRLLCRCGEPARITWTCVFPLQRPGSVNAFVHQPMTVIYAEIHEMCSEYSLALIHWLYMVFQSCSLCYLPGFDRVSLSWQAN